MMTHSQGKFILLLISLILFALFPGYAYSAGSPTVIPGTDPAATHLGAVNFREFTSGGNEEIFLGVPDLNLGGANRTVQHLTWESANTITFTYDVALDRLTTSIVNGTGNWTLNYDNFSTNVGNLVYGGDQAAADYALSQLNYLQINVTLKEKSPAQVSFDDVELDGIPLGDFSGVYHGIESWYVDGYDFSAGFNLTGVLNLSGVSSPSPEKNKVEIIIGAIVVDVPLVSNVLAAPNLALPETEITLTATAQDSGTNNIQSAEYNIDGGSWNTMEAQDGTFDSAAENIIATFSAPVDHGVYNVCVRATNAASNTGQEQCTDLSVDAQGPVSTDLQVTPNPVTSGKNVTLVATADDLATGGSNIQSAQYNIAGGPWKPLTAQDGSFDSPNEIVEATFVISNEPGELDLCVRGKDDLGNSGAVACTQLTVSANPNAKVNNYLPCIINQSE